MKGSRGLKQEKVLRSVYTWRLLALRDFQDCLAGQLLWSHRRRNLLHARWSNLVFDLLTFSVFRSQRPVTWTVHNREFEFMGQVARTDFSPRDSTQVVHSKGLVHDACCITRHIIAYHALSLSPTENTGKQQVDFYFFSWIFFAFVSTCYTYIWDVKMDWGLMDPNHGYLRAKLLFKHLVSNKKNKMNIEFSLQADLDRDSSDFWRFWGR